MTAPPFTISDWKPLHRNTLRGFLTAHLPSGLTLHEMSVHTRDGTWWVTPASKPMLGKDGTGSARCRRQDPLLADRLVRKPARPRPLHPGGARCTAAGASGGVRGRGGHAMSAATADEVTQLAINLARNCGYAVFPCGEDKRAGDPHGVQRRHHRPRSHRVALATLSRPVDRHRHRIAQRHLGARHRPQAPGGCACGGRTIIIACCPPAPSRPARGGLHLHYRTARCRLQQPGQASVEASIPAATAATSSHWFADGFDCLDQPRRTLAGMAAQ